MFNFFKKSSSPADLSWLGPDMHSHLLPALDDGAADLQTSLVLLEGLQQLGFQKIFTTPHIFKELYPNSTESISAALQLLQAGIREANLQITIDAAAEYMLDEHFHAGSDLVCLPQKHVLIEMSYLAEFPHLEQTIFDLQLKGYTVILAHPERYNFYHENFKKYHRLKDRGCLFQLNLLSVTGYYGRPVKNIASRLVKAGLYDLAGTDLHHEKHLLVLKNAVKSGQLYKEIGHYPFLNKKLFQ